MKPSTVFLRRWRRIGIVTILVVTAFSGAACLRFDASGVTFEARPHNDFVTPAIEGIWRWEGYGRWVEIERDQITIYDVTQGYCVPSIELPRHLASDFLLGNYVPPDQLQFQIIPEITQYSLMRKSQLPDHCSAQNLDSEAHLEFGEDPIYNFGIFWQIFQEHYPFFAERNLDWEQQYERFRPQVTSHTPPEELWSIFQKMVSPLRDGHVSLQNENEDFSSETLPQVLPGVYAEFLAQQTGSKEAFKEEAFEEAFEEEAFEDYAERALREVMEIVQDHYLQGDFTEAANDLIFWGTLEGNIGYLHVLSMEGYSGEDDSVYDLEELKEALEPLQEAWQTWDALIVDVRFNGGGSDEIALWIAQHFTKKQHLAFRKQAKDRSGMTPLQTVYLEPATRTPFVRPIVLLTSRMTGSAAEVFTLSLKDLPHVTLLGDRTGGAFSDVLEKPLPNGWLLELSNEVYSAANGTVYEAQGIPPDIPVSLFTQADRRQQRDAALERAMAWVKEGP